MRKLVPVSVVTICLIFLFACNTQKKSVTLNQRSVEQREDPDYKREIIVDLKKGIKPELIEVKFAKYSCNLHRIESSQENTYTYRFDPDKIAQHALLAEIKKLDEVEYATFMIE